MTVTSNVYTNKKGKTSINLRISVQDAAAFMVGNVDTMNAMKAAVADAMAAKEGTDDGQG